MQLCGFVDELVGGRICLPASTLSSSRFCFLFLFLDTDHSALGFRRPPAQQGKMAANVEMCRWSFCAENVREREGERGLLYCIGHSYGLYVKRNNSFFLIILFIL